MIPMSIPNLHIATKGIVVFSGGSAANSLVDIFDDIAEKRGTPLSYIIPISDNGGSSSELIRVFGGPGIGDIRSRLVRLIPPDQPHIAALLNHRLPKSRHPAASEWQDIVSGTSSLWTPIPADTRELLRSMLNHVNFEIMKRVRPPLSTFNFSSASVGNLFLTGARLFTGSFESAIRLLALICGIADGGCQVIPAINSNFSHHISAGLMNGDSITGQNAISHPSEPTALVVHPTQTVVSDVMGLSAITISERPSPAILPSGLTSRDSTINPATPLSLDLSADSDPEDANLPGSLHALRKAEIHFSKSHDTEEDLACRIERVWYINPYGQEMSPAANPKAVSVIRDAEAIVYSIGSLYTSIVPCLILRGIGEAIASTPKLKWKILILNGSIDRETGPKSNPMGALDFVAAIARAGEESRGNREGIPPEHMWRRYVTHLIYLEAEGAPKVNKQALAAMGIDCVRCWARKAEDGSWLYDPNGLAGALEAILGRGDKAGPRSRRNTMQR